MTLQDAKQRRNVARDVDDDLAWRRPAPAEENAAHAHERLGVSLVLDAFDLPGQQLAQAPLAADIGCSRPNGRNCSHFFNHGIPLNNFASPDAAHLLSAGRR